MTEPTKAKNYSLSKQELSDLVNRAAIKEQHLYQATLVNQDMEYYVDTYVKPRLGLPTTQRIEIDLKGAKIIVLEAPKNPTGSGKPPTPPIPVVKATPAVPNEQNKSH